MPNVVFSGAQLLARPLQLKLGATVSERPIEQCWWRCFAPAQGVNLDRYMDDLLTLLSRVEPDVNDDRSV